MRAAPSWSGRSPYTEAMSNLRLGRSPKPTVVAVAAVLDIVLVVVFAVIGRASHDEGPAGVLVTAWPFLVGLAVGWLLTRAWLRPRNIVWTGIGVWIATVAGGMLLRLMSGQGIAVAFIIVATVVLGAALIGWRLVAILISRRAEIGT